MNVSQPAVRIQRRKAVEIGKATCQQCGWKSSCTRGRARQHVINSGHPVDYIVPDVTTYSLGES